MNHRLKDKAAILSATSLQGDKRVGARLSQTWSQMGDPTHPIPGCPKTLSPRVPQHSVQGSRTVVHEFKATRKRSSASPRYSLKENKINQNICMLLSKPLLFFLFNSELSCKEQYRFCSSGNKFLFDFSVQRDH